ncbi:MAG: hypothetical protein WDN49_26510 [Acetobacteraceae bacterium]
MYGDGYFQKLEKNNPTISRSIIDSMTSRGLRGMQGWRWRRLQRAPERRGRQPDRGHLSNRRLDPEHFTFGHIEEIAAPQRRKTFHEFLLSADMSA